MNERNELPQILQNLSKQMGREPEPTVASLQDYAPKAKDIKAEQISEGLRELVEKLLAIQAASHDKLDAQAQLLARLHTIVSEMEAVIL